MGRRTAGVIRQYPKTFWSANSLELFERWAYYGIFNLLALYLTGSQDTGALGFTQVEKGLVMGIVNAILYFLPIITGSIADKFGYKKVLLIAFIILSTGYYLMGVVTSFAGIFLTFFYVAIGAALFKPIISATIAKTTDEKTASIGFGIFYMIINIGGLIGPLVASELREMNWQYIFIMSSGAILVNIVILLIFYKDSDKPEQSEPLGQAIKMVFVNVYRALKDVKLLLFLLIIIGGWTVYWQFFYSLPVFIDQWHDTTVITQSIGSVFPGIANAISNADGVIAAEKFITMAPFFIILFQVLISAIVSRYKPINTMIIGFVVNTTGLTLAFLTNNGWILLLAIMIFAFGEMAYSPKILEYISRIAPRDKAALYMGSNFIPMAIGNFIGGLLSGRVYEITADKVSLLRRELENWNVNLPEISEQFTLNDYYQQASEVMGMDPASLTDYLWLNYYPSRFGFVLLGIGITTGLLLIVYDKIIFRYR